MDNLSVFCSCTLDTLLIRNHRVLGQKSVNQCALTGPKPCELLLIAASSSTHLFQRHYQVPLFHWHAWWLHPKVLHWWRRLCPSPHGVQNKKQLTNLFFLSFSLIHASALAFPLICLSSLWTLYYLTHKVWIDKCDMNDRRQFFWHYSYTDNDVMKDFHPLRWTGHRNAYAPTSNWYPVWQKTKEFVCRSKHDYEFVWCD